MEAVFKALGHAARRSLLDLLRQRDGRTLRELDTHLAMTRFGTMKHLRILEAAGLVVTRKVGREKRHYLNPVPIRLIHDRWISKYSEPWAGALGDLKRLEEPEMNGPKHVYEVYVRATPAQVWEAITDPARSSDYFYGTLVKSDWREGSRLAYDYPDGRLAAEGTILEVDPPRRLVHTFSATWDQEVTADAPHTVAWSIEPMGATCRVSCEHYGFAGETATYRSVSGGLSLILNGLKTLLETGEPLAIGR
jgi:uncharacterized protein YndB with AHSA1/START domain/DNA-binding transcriptional ArsR family regulator